MTAKSDAYENDLLLLIFNNVAMSGVGDAGGIQPSVAAGNLFVALHSADPGEAGVQSTNEVGYTGYGRVGVVRSSAGWTVVANAVSNTGTVTFGECTAGSVTATHFSVGVAVSGATKILYKGLLSGGGLPIAANITPQFAAGELDIAED